MCPNSHRPITIDDRPEPSPWVAAAIFLLAVAGFLYLYRSSPSSDIPTGTALPSSTAVFETSLASRISSTDTSMTLAANSVRGGSTLSGYQCFTVDEGRTDAEYICGSVSGTTVSSLERGIDPATATTSNAALKFAHRVGANVKITDFPLIGRLRAQNNGSDTFDNLLNYKYSPSYVGASTTAIVSYGLLQQATFAGTVNGDESTKGIYELATGLEAASSTQSGSTAARLALSTKSATDTPQACTLANPCIPVTNTLGKIAQAFLDLTQPFTWTAAHIFGSTVTFNGATTFNVAPTFGTFSATSTNSTSTISGNLLVSNNASTTNLTVSTACTGCWKQKSGATTRAGDTASGSQTIAHGLGVIPRYVRITAFKKIGSNAIAHSEGTFAASTNTLWFTVVGATEDGGADSTNIILIHDDVSSSATQIATLAVDATNLTLTWTKAGSPTSANISILWEAFY